MKKSGWFCLLLLWSACMPVNQDSAWDGNYIGYYHRNHKDTTLVKMTFSGKFFAAAPHYATDGVPIEGVFEQQQSTLVFHHVLAGQDPLLQGAYQFQVGPDGSVRLWQQTPVQYQEIILRLQ